MATGDLNRMILRAGLSVVAALLLSSAGFAQDASGDGRTATVDLSTVDPAPVDIAIDPVVTDGGDPGIAVGEPDPTGDGTGDGTVAGDGSGDGTVADDGSGDGTVAGDGTSDGTGDGTVVGDGTGDGTVVGDGTGDGTVVGDGTGDGTVISYSDGTSDCGGCEMQNMAGPLLTPALAGTPGKAGHRAAVAAGVAPAATASASGSGSGNYVAHTPVTRAAQACLTQHPGLPWLCEWQNGAGN